MYNLYTAPEAHGYLMEAKACKKVVKEIDRLADKYRRAVDKEKAAKKAELETVMQYRNEGEIQNDYGWEYITEAQYQRYIELICSGKEALENGPPSVNEIIVSVLHRINSDILRDQTKREFSALSSEEQAAERKRLEESQKAWKKRIAEIKNRLPA